MSEINIKRIRLWEECIFDLTLPEVDNDSILGFYEELESKEAGQKKSNIGGWQREVTHGECPAYDHMLYLTEVAVTDIFQNVFQVDVQIEVANSWLNSNILGESNAFHTHPGCLFSGVYYINASKDKENGSINFVNPNHHVIEDYIQNLPLRVPGLPTKEALNLYNDKIFTSHQHAEPQVSHAYVFPPWLGHEVRKNPHAFNRLVVGINFKAVDRVR